MGGAAEAAARRALDRGLLANSAGRPARASSSFRAALRRLGDHDPADLVPEVLTERAYLRSRSLLGLVISEFELHADVAAGESGLDAAERWAQVAGAGGLLVAIQGQRGLMRLRGGDLPAAVRALDRAVAHLDEAEPVDACRVLLNRGSLLLELGRLDQARDDLRGSAERAEALGDGLRMFKARHNLGYLEFLAGDLPAALSAMADAASVEHGASPGVALLDRAQVLLEAGLVTEADQTLAEAAQLFADHRLAHDLAQVELTRAHCALLARRPAEALRWARSARRRFVRRGNTPWSVRAELAVCQAELALLLDTGGGPTALAAVGRRSLALVGPPGAGRSGVDLPTARAARVTAAEAFAAAGRVDLARATLTAAGRATGHEPLAVAVQRHLVRAQIAVVGGDGAGARRHVRAGQAVLAEHRRQLGSVEAVAAAAVHGARLVELDVGAALATGRAEPVLDAVERGRATFAGAARVQPPTDPRLAELLAELRQCVERARAIAPDAGPAAVAEGEALTIEASRLRELARERAWRLGEGVDPPRPLTARGVRALLSGRRDGSAVVDLVVHAGSIHAVVVERTRTRLVEVAAVGDVAPLLRRVRTDLEVLTRPLVPGLADVAGRSLRRGLGRLDDLLLAPLGDLGPLHLVATGGLLTVPWAALPSRRGVPTSVSSHLAEPQPAPRALDTAAPPRAPRVVAVAGPGLTHAEGEVAAIGRQWPDATVLVGEQAVCAAAREALATADVVHLAAHGHHERESPLFSWVRLADGPLFAHELDGISLPGSVVVLSACEVGRVTERPGGEVLGLANVLLRLGARAVVAGLAPLRDDVAATVMQGLHHRLHAGEQPATALAGACLDVDEAVPLACFVPSVP